MSTREDPDIRPNLSQDHLRCPTADARDLSQARNEILVRCHVLGNAFVDHCNAQVQFIQVIQKLAPHEAVMVTDLALYCNQFHPQR